MRWITWITKLVGLKQVVYAVWIPKCPSWLEPPANMELWFLDWKAPDVGGFMRKRFFSLWGQQTEGASLEVHTRLEYWRKTWNWCKWGKKERKCQGMQMLWWTGGLWNDFHKETTFSAPVNALQIEIFDKLSAPERLPANPALLQELFVHGGLQRVENQQSEVLEVQENPAVWTPPFGILRNFMQLSKLNLN